MRFPLRMRFPVRMRSLRVRRSTLTLGVAAASALGLAACDNTPPATDASSSAEVPLATSTTSPTTTTAGPPSTASGAGASDSEAFVVTYRVERRTNDPETADFVAVVAATLADTRGWIRAGFELRPDPASPHLVVLAEGPEVDALCEPYQTHSTYSCQNGPVVAVNADRWRSATDRWTGDLAAYRQMLVNHEVGHLLGQRHPEPQCPAPGEPAPVMAQQSTELDGCLPNTWPLDWEIAVAARHDQPIAPGYGE